VENLGFESFFVAEHMVVPSTYTTHYPRSRDGKVPEFYARLIDPFHSSRSLSPPKRPRGSKLAPPFACSRSAM
jgi:hypothetical protein